MKRMMTVVAILGVLCSVSVVSAETSTCSPKRDCHGKILRSAKQVNAFKRTHPCPTNGNLSGKCPGYIVDHIVALCVCGKDRASNMQWQTVADAKIKDRTECKIEPANKN